MLVRIATAPGREGRDNEDFAAAAPGACVAIDGAGFPAAFESGCVHSVAWYARTLGGLLLAHAVRLDLSLPDALAEAITGVNALHGGACDLGHPGTPSATVTAVRLNGDQLEHLVLADSTILLDLTDTEPAAISDRRLSDITRQLKRSSPTAYGSAEHAAAQLGQAQQLAEHRNRPGGFWVAASNPDAAHHALTGTTPLTTMNAVVLLTDGATRLADRFHTHTWHDVLNTLDRAGPEELLRLTRATEATDPDGRRWPRSKANDDATALHWQLRAKS